MSDPRPGPVGATRPRAPGPLRAARVMVWVQCGGWGLGVLAGVVAAASSVADLDGDGGAFAGLGAFVGLLLAVICLIALALLVPPVALLRDSRRGTRVGSLVALCVGQALTAVPIALVPLVVPLQTVIAAALALLVVASAVVVIVLAAQPASRAWVARP